MNATVCGHPLPEGEKRERGFCSGACFTGHGRVRKHVHTLFAEHEIDIGGEG